MPVPNAAVPVAGTVKVDPPRASVPPPVMVVLEALVMVPALLTPVPPLAAGNIPETSAARLTADHEGFPDALP